MFNFNRGLAPALNNRPQMPNQQHLHKDKDVKIVGTSDTLLNSKQQGAVLQYSSQSLLLLNGTLDR